MRNFITIKNEKERKIFLDYCKKNNIVLATGRKVESEKVFNSYCSFQIFFNDRFNYLTYSLGSTFAQEGDGCYNEIKFNNFFKAKVSVLEIE